MCVRVCGKGGEERRQTNTHTLTHALQRLPLGVHLQHASHAYAQAHSRSALLSL